LTIYDRLIDPKPGTPNTIENVHICLNCVFGMTALRYGELTCQLDGVTRPDHAGVTTGKGMREQIGECL
jgi:hypothetical protein